MRVLIADFDFFSATGGGQTFYRRVVERHPEITFFYPSRGPDLAVRKRLPRNALPFPFELRTDENAGTMTLQAAGYDGYTVGLASALGAFATVLQGEWLDVVEIPSFFPCAHLVRPVLAAHGIVVGRVSLGLLGWQSGSLAHDPNYRGLMDRALRAAEASSIAAADTRYTISDLHAAENAGYGAPVERIDMIDALEAFPVPPAAPPGSGPPDLWYVGRLDPAKAPDLFLAIAAAVPRHLYRRLCLTGPDATWLPPGERWSDHVRAAAAALGLDVDLRGLISDAVLRQDVYRGRTVLVVPSRTDSFNLVALEALANGCPLLLSRHTGAADFLKRRLAHIVPPVIEPSDVAASAAELARLLADYDRRAAALRAALRERPLPSPRAGFMLPFWRDAPLAPLAAPDRVAHDAVRARLPLLGTAAVAWRPLAAAATDRGVAIAIVHRDAPGALAATLANVVRQQPQPAEILVVDDGTAGGFTLARSLPEYGSAVRLLRQGRRGLAAALNRACADRAGGHLLLLVAGDLLRPGALAQARAAAAGAAPAVRLPFAVSGAGSLAPRPEAESGPVPPTLVVPRAVLAAGGYGAADDGWSVSLPPAVATMAAGDSAPWVWRPDDALAPWAGNRERRAWAEAA